MPNALDEYLKNAPASEQATLNKASQSLQQNNAQLDKQTGQEPQAPAPMNTKTDPTPGNLDKGVENNIQAAGKVAEPNAVDRAQERTAQAQTQEPAQQLQKNDVSLQPDNER